MDNETNTAITKCILTWYRAQARDLPWRHMDDPYQIWVSEIMLQQTQVVTVIPYFTRFVARYPTVHDLAEASLDQVLALWQGLGYYSRGRNLHAAARRLVACHGGALPASREALLALPGIGAYTAGAILSIAYGQDEPAIDGNVVRVFCRLYAYETYPGNAAGKRTMDRYARVLIPPGEAGTFNQGLMELGATVCTPRSPACDRCPVRDLCQARERGIQHGLPVRRARRAVPHKTALAALCERAGRLLIVRRRPEGLLGGLWELPGDLIKGDRAQGHDLERLLWEHAAMDVSVGCHLAVVDHAYTHFRLTVHVFRATVRGDPVPNADSSWDSWHWLAPAERDAYGLTGVTTKTLARVPWAGSRLLL